MSGENCEHATVTIDCKYLSVSRDLSLNLFTCKCFQKQKFQCTTCNFLSVSETIHFKNP